MRTHLVEGFAVPDDHGRVVIIAALELRHHSNQLSDDRKAEL